MICSEKEDVSIRSLFFKRSPPSYLRLSNKRYVEPSIAYDPAKNHRQKKEPLSADGVTFCVSFIKPEDQKNTQDQGRRTHTDNIETNRQVFRYIAKKATAECFHSAVNIYRTFWEITRQISLTFDPATN